jgi:hypothetical protein
MLGVLRGVYVTAQAAGYTVAADGVLEVLRRLGVLSLSAEVGAQQPAPAQVTNPLQPDNIYETPLHVLTTCPHLSVCRLHEIIHLLQQHTATHPQP